MDRLKELSKIIQDANTEVREIHENYKKEKNNNCIGKCYSDYVDNGDNHMDYYIVLSVNSHGDMKGNKLSVWEERSHIKKVLFSKDVFIDDWVVKESEISLDKFNEKWSDCLIEMEK